MLDHEKLRMQQLEQTLKLAYEKLHAFERRKTATNDVAERFSLSQRIREEVLPDLRQYEKEYAELLAESADPAKMPDEESETLVGEALEAVGATERVVTDGTPQAVLRLLNELKDKLNEPGKSAAAKLKVSLPIIPLIAAYELELDTENLLGAVWRKARSLFQKALPDHP